MIREGYIEKIVYKSDETGYCVMSVEGEEGEEIFVGTLPGAGEGLYVIAEGEYVNHPQYDIQFKFSSCEIQMPKDTLGIERYLGSGIIKGIGAVLAKKIVKKFRMTPFGSSRRNQNVLRRSAEFPSERHRRLLLRTWRRRNFRRLPFFWHSMEFR